MNYQDSFMVIWGEYHNMMNRSRKQLRMQGYDYSNSGYYFVTICTANHIEYFGTISDGKMVLNPFGKCAQTIWHEIPRHWIQMAKIIL